MLIVTAIEGTKQPVRAGSELIPKVAIAPKSLKLIGNWLLGEDILEPIVPGAGIGREEHAAIT